MYRLRTPAEEIARTLLIVLRRGSLSAAEEITGHKQETIGKWLRLAGEHAEALTHALVHDLKVEEAEVDAFWSFVGNAVRALQTGQVRNKRWASQLRPRGTEKSPPRRDVEAGFCSDRSRQVSTSMG
jgi:hypothetical protein